ncbi:MAG TPA: Mur ligase family protein [Vicinamibacterales bacterium]|nr:Mur ligase family protein [Vicinamibacterales bacterium]
MRLSTLAADLGSAPLESDPEISGLTEDSRRVAPGMLFVAVPGTALDGHAYIAEAVNRGAVAVVAERAGTVPAGVPVVRVPSARAALAVLAARFSNHPADGLHLIGFTGTFGKTSTSEILRRLLEAGGVPTGVLGSLGARYRSFHDPGTGLTTPAPVELHRSLAGLRAAGAGTVIMEVTSHALTLGRVRGVTFAGGLLAGILPGEHTDFHRSYEDYVAAKRLFLEYLAPDAMLAYDADNRAARMLARDVGRAAGFSLAGRDADLQFYDVLADRHGATFSLGGRAVGRGSGTRLHSTLLGQGHLRNVALALTYALEAGVPLEAARDVLGSLEPLRRRMERFAMAGRTVLDDTAGHADSLRATFDVASLLPHDRVAVVYALRGRRGAEINRQNALALAGLVALHGAEPLIVTAAVDGTGPADKVEEPEIDATRQALVSRGRRFIWHDALASAVQDALVRTAPGDLIVLVGAQGMNRGREFLERIAAGEGA